MTRPSFARIAHFSLAVLILGTFSTATAFAQSAQPSQPAQSTATAPASAPPTPQTNQAPQKKVWTNDNLIGSPDPAGNSIAAITAGPNAGTSSPSKSKSKKDAKWYHDQIAKLQSQIPPLDKSIAELQAVLDGKTVNEPQHNGGNRIGDWKDQLQQLEKKRQDALDKISALEDAARHNGVAPNALP
jgi:hypothetical protein